MLDQIRNNMDLIVIAIVAWVVVHYLRKARGKPGLF